MNGGGALAPRGQEGTWASSRRGGGRARGGKARPARDCALRGARARGERKGARGRGGRRTVESGRFSLAGTKGRPGGSLAGGTTSQGARDRRARRPGEELGGVWRGRGGRRETKQKKKATAPPTLLFLLSLFRR